MTIENVPLFDLFTAEDATEKQLLDAFNDGINPETGEYDESFQDELGDVRHLWRQTKTPIGTFLSVIEWNGGDGREQGIVVRHKESGILLMATGTYSSWDSSDWDDWVIAEPFTFTETRYKEKTTRP